MKGLFFFAMLIVPPSAFAEMCDDPHTQIDLNYCAKFHFDRADGELNDVYGRLKTGYATYADAKAALVSAQRAWVMFRDAECNQDVVAVEGGSVAPMIKLDCKTRLTDARTQQLQDRLNCKEGDLSCVAIGDAAD
jgi:uncharacterized protein YecT (DUF1311 family)